MFTAIRKNLLIPLHETAIKRRSIAKYRRFLNDSQWWPRERLVEYQRQELGRLLRHAYEQVPFWRRTFDASGLSPNDMRGYADFIKLPVIDKATIRAQKTEMIARSHVDTNWKKSTGGSTGEPLHFEYTADSYDWRVACSRRGYGWAGYEEGMRQVSIWGAWTPEGTTAFRLWKEELHRRMAGRILVNSFKFDEQHMARSVEIINHHKPVNIVGYSNPLYDLARFINRRAGLQHHPRSVLSAAETLYLYQREEIEKAFDCPVFETYGSREFMLIGAECDHKHGLHLSIENLLVEVVDEDGSPIVGERCGDLVVTDLHNYGMPFIRYRIGDIGELTDELCSCGRGLPLLKKVIGRSLDVIRTPTGASIAGEFFPHLMKDFAWIKQFQVIQDRLDHLRLMIVQEPNATEAELESLKQEMSKLCAGELTVDYEFVAAIPLTSTGKRRVTVSNIGILQ